jgi:hypothetical protein
MAHLRVSDDNVTARFRQKPPNDRPATVHPGQPLPGASSPISPSASTQRNVDQQMREEQETHSPAASRQRIDPKDSPLFTSSDSSVAEAARETRVQQHQHTAGITPIDHPGASSRQSPNDSGTRGARVPG